MRLAIAVQTLVGLALLLASAAGLSGLLHTVPPYPGPFPVLSPRRLVVLLVLLSGCWLVVNQPAEGKVLLTVLPGRGLTTADLLVVPPLALAGLLLLRELLRRV